MKLYFLALATLLVVAVGCAGEQLQASPPPATPEPAVAVPELFASIPAQSSQVAAVHDATVDEGKQTRAAIDNVGKQLQDGLQTLRSAIATIELPQAPVERSAPAGDPPAKPEPMPTLLLFSAPWCVNCPAMKARIPILEATGEVVKVVDVDKDSTVPYGLKREIHAVPTWVRLDKAGNEVDRVPADDNMGFNDADLRRVLKLTIVPMPAPARKAALPVPMPSPRPMLRRAGRRH